MNSHPPSDSASLPFSVWQRIDRVCARFEAAWQAGGPEPRLEDYLAGATEGERAQLFSELLQLERELRQQRGLALPAGSYRERFPEYRDLIDSLSGALPAPGWLREARQPTEVLASSPAPPPRPDPPQPLPDLSAAGYEVLEELGRGGMAVVYKARQTGLKRLVALKMIVGAGRSHSDQLLRFRVEGEVVARLRHPNIVQVYEVGTHAGQPYLALEYVDGGTLADRLDGTPHPPRQAVALVEALARAVHVAHQAGVVHRDLKPANVLLAACGSAPAACGLAPDAKPQAAYTPKITDFGLAKHLHADLRLTQTGYVVGTPHYMAPEQFRTESDAVTPATDVYALGVLLYELLTGRLPIPGKDLMRLVEQVRDDRPAAPRQLAAGLPRDLDSICLKCLEKAPGRRYASAEALAEDLRRFQQGEPTLARPVGPLVRSWLWARRRPALAGLALGIVAAVLAGSGASLYFGFQALGRAHDAEQAEGRARRSAGQTQEALGQAQQAKRESDLRAAQLAFREGLAQCEAGAVDRGLFTLVEALRQTPADERAFRRVLRANLAAWGRQLPVLRHAVVLADGKGRFLHARFLGPDGAAFVTWREFGPIRRWDTATGQPADLSWSLPDGERVLDVSPDGTRMATATGKSDAGGLRDLATGQVHARGLQHRRSDGTPIPTWVMASPSGRVALTRGDDFRLNYAFRRFWALPACKELPMTYQLHDGDGCSLTADRDGKDVLLVFRHHPDPRQAAVPPMAEFWDVAGGRRLEAFRPAVGLDPRFGWDGRTVLSICGDESFSTAFANACDGSVFWWDPATGRQAGEPWRPHRTAKCSALSADSLVLAARCDDQRGRLYDLATGLQRGGDIPLTGTRDTEPGLRLAVSPDGGSVLTGAADGTFRLWQTRGSELQASAASNPRPHGVPHNRLTFDRAAFRPDGRVALVAQLGEQAQPCFLVDVASGQALGQPLQLPNPRHLAFSADGRLAAMAVTPDVGPPSLRVWDAATGRPRTPPLQSPTLVHGLAFSPDGHTLAAAGVGGTFLFDVDRAALRALLHEGTTAYRLVFRPDGRRVAVAYKSGWTAKGAGFRLRDPVTAQPVGAFVPLPRPPDGLPVLHLSFAEGGRLLRVFDADNGRLHVHDAETGERRAEPSTLEPAEQVAFSPDGSLLATSSPNGHVRQWDAATGKALEPLLLSPSPVLALQFSGDGKVLAAVCQDHAVRLWDAATSLPLGPPLLHRAGVLGLAFRADGTLATVTATGRTQTWSLPEPVADDPERLQLWIEATAGVKLRGDEVALLDADDWRGKKGPPGDARPGPDDATWHERRALDAEEDGNTFALFWHLERLDKLRPGDWRVPARRGRAYRDAGDATRAGAAYEEAQARQPGEALRDWYRREAARWASLEKGTESLWYLERLAAAGADDAALYADRALVHGKLGHAGERDADLNRALERGAEDGVALPRVEEAAHAGHWEEAAAWCAKVKGGGPADPDFAYIQSLVCLKAGAAAGYRRACARALQALPPAGKPREGDAVNLVVVLCTLGPDGVSDWPPLLGRMERLTAALAGQEARVPSELRHEVRERRHAWLNTYGAALYRAGRYAEAVARLRSAIAAQGQGGTFRDWVFLALAHSGLGQTGEARPWLEKARAARPAAAPFSWEGLEADLLLAEAERRASGPAP